MLATIVMKNGDEFVIDHPCFGFLESYYCNGGDLALEDCGNDYEAVSYRDEADEILELSDIDSVKFEMGSKEAKEAVEELLSKMDFKDCYSWEGFEIVGNLDSAPVDKVITVMRIAKRYDDNLHSTRFDKLVDSGVPAKSALFLSMILYYTSYLGKDQGFRVETDTEEFIHNPYRWAVEDIILLLTGHKLEPLQGTLAEESGYKRDNTDDHDGSNLSDFLNIKGGETTLWSLAKKYEGNRIPSDDVKTVFKPIIDILG